MKKLMAAALLAVPFLASSVRADGCGSGCKICTPCVRICIPSFCMKVWCKGCPPCGSPCGGGGGCGLLGSFCGGNCGYGGGLNGPVGPWYLYWPLEAHFNAPALPQYPYWPAPMGMAPGAPIGGPAVGAANYQGGGFQQVGYVPSYWYR